MEWTFLIEQAAGDHLGVLSRHYRGLRALVVARMAQVQEDPEPHLRPVACASADARVCVLEFPSELAVPLQVVLCVRRDGAARLLRVSDLYAREV